MLKILLGVVTIIVLYILFSYLHFLYILQHSSNPKIVQHSEIFGSGPTIKYIAAGDSTAVGIGASEVSRSYPYKFAKYLAQKNTVQYQNVAVSGAKTADLIKVQMNQIVAFNPDLITISIGPNDATHLLSLGTVENNFKDILEKLKEQTHAHIYVTDIASFTGSGLFPGLYVDFLEYRSASINPKLLKLADSRVTFADIHNFGWSKFSDRKITYSSDRFHPNDLGYQNWTDAFINAYQQSQK